MIFRIPDPLRYEIRYQVGRLGIGLERLGIGGRIRTPGWVAGGLILAVVLLLTRLGVWLLSPSHVTPFKTGPKAWFYDLNSGKLFVVPGGGEGPIAAPSGPLPDGRPAGVRAHVYSHVLKPKESELFVGFLEKPDSNAESARGAKPWGRGRLIKRPKDKQWVSATSPEGNEILQTLTRANDRGQTPIYQVPH